MTVFSAEERATLLALKGVGETVVARLEQMGFHSLQQLSQATVLDVLEKGAELSGSSCWKNSPQAKAAILRVIEAAKLETAKTQSE